MTASLLHPLQTHSWTFNAFELYQKTHGNPLITVTLTLLESYDLLVRVRSRGQKGLAACGAEPPSCSRPAGA